MTETVIVALALKRTPDSSVGAASVSSSDVTVASPSPFSESPLSDASLSSGMVLAVAIQSVGISQRLLSFGSPPAMLPDSSEIELVRVYVVVVASPLTVVVVVKPPLTVGSGRLASPSAVSVAASSSFVVCCSVASEAFAVEPVVAVWPLSKNDAIHGSVVAEAPEVVAVSPAPGDATVVNCGSDVGCCVPCHVLIAVVLKPAAAASIWPL